MDLPTHITLTGFMGTGKSTVARLVADRLGWEAVDADELLAEEAGRPIPELFETEGELAFRRREARIYEKLATRRNVVVAAGGGAPLLDETRRVIVAAGLVVCLDATPATIASRLPPRAESGRPMLAGALSRIEKLKAQRDAVYALADLTLHVDALTPSEVADEVVRFYQLRGAKAWSRPGRLEQLSARPAVLPPILDAPGATTIVRTASAEYPAYVSWGALERLGEYVERATGARRAFILSDQSVLPVWGETAVSSLKAKGIETHSYALDPGDASKSLGHAAEVYDWLASSRAERRDAVIGLGGGMVNDFAGFVAGTYLRGMPVVQAPTSLLAMVDASIGGKTALNHAGAKNIVGLFNQPRAVVADVATLKTLPRRALVEGMGEVIKHALIRDPELLELLEEQLEGVLALEPELATRVIARNVQIKGEVVSEDERETGGVREILNYGHTLGHAFEAAGGYEMLLHGEAVGAGMMAAAEIGRRHGVTPPELVERQRRLIERAGLPLRPPPGMDRQRIRAALALDKKVVAGGQRWVLLEDVARPVVRSDIPSETVEAVLDDLLAV